MWMHEDYYAVVNRLQGSQRARAGMHRFFFAFVVAALIATSGGTSAQYEVLCNSMIRLAQEAAAAYNQGNVNKAESLVQQVHKAFESAVALEPSEAQAFLNMAVFLSNTHKYDEAIQQFEAAKSLVLGNRQAETQIAFGIRRAKSQKFAKLRDETYQRGTGDVEKAHAYAVEQLAASFEPHLVNHDVGTMETMLCEYNTTHCAKSAARFRAAAFATQGLYMQRRMPSNKARMACLHSKLLVGNFSGLEFVEVVASSAASSVFFNHIGDGVVVHGQDGVLTFEDERHCQVALTSSDYYANVGRSLPVHTPNGPPPPPEPLPSVTLENRKVLLLTQFSGAAFYHWMCEAIPRLVVSMKSLPDFGSYALLIPALPSGAPRFVSDTFTSLFPGMSNELYEHRAVSRASGTAVAVTWGSQPCPGLSAEFAHCASLAAADALVLARDEIVKVVAAYPQPKKDYILVALRGASTTMRHFDEEKLLAAVKAVVGSDGRFSGLEVETFDASRGSLLDNLALFHGATAVVGVHGGALANIMSCRRGTGLLEIGFTTIGAQQYQHVSAALGMHYRRVWVTPDVLKRALGAPEVDFAVPEVMGALASLLNSAAETRSQRDEL